jgi:uncharacterized protein (TIGR02246 family)
MKITASLVASIAVLVIAMPRMSYAEELSSDSICPKHLHQRTVAQVLNAHLAAFQSGDAQLVACDYAKDAVFIMPETVTRGRANIQAAFAYFITLAGGNIQVTTNSLTIADDVALFEYAVTSCHVTVSDGVDTFVIDNGLIVVQTARLGGFTIK